MRGRFSSRVALGEAVLGTRTARIAREVLEQSSKMLSAYMDAGIELLEALQVRFEENEANVACFL